MLRYVRTDHSSSQNLTRIQLASISFVLGLARCLSQQPVRLPMLSLMAKTFDISGAFFYMRYLSRMPGTYLGPTCLLSTQNKKTRVRWCGRTRPAPSVSCVYTNERRHTAQTSKTAHFSQVRHHWRNNPKLLMSLRSSKEETGLEDSGSLPSVQRDQWSECDRLESLRTKIATNETLHK